VVRPESGQRRAGGDHYIRVAPVIRARPVTPDPGLQIDHDQRRLLTHDQRHACPPGHGDTVARHHIRAG
jgi:hypothetical protein